MITNSPIPSREIWERFSDKEKIDHLYRYAIAAWQAGERMAAALAELEDRLAKKNATP